MFSRSEVFVGVDVFDDVDGFDEDVEEVVEGVEDDSTVERLGSVCRVEIVGVDGGAGDPPSWISTALTPFTSDSSSLGRERASATKFALPSTYRMSVVYSAMQDNWYICRAV